MSYCNNFFLFLFKLADEYVPEIVVRSLDFPVIYVTETVGGE